MRLIPPILFAATLAHSAAAEGTPGATQHVAEIVTFRLVEGTDPKAFIDAANDMTPFLQSTDAMIARTLSSDDTGLWTDHVTWTSLAAAKSAAARMFERPEARPFIAMINPEGMTMRHASIHLAQE
jgi:predicted component of type VI protein secretion system